MSSLSIKTVSSSYSQLGYTQEDTFHPQKFKVTLLGRFMRETREEYPCRLEEISLYELSAITSILPKVGEKVFCLIDRLGLLEGHVERHLDNGFFQSINLTKRGRGLLASRLQKLSSKDNSKVISGVSQDSLFSSSNLVEISFCKNTKSRCLVEDLCLFGASIITQARPPIGSEITLNQIKSRVEHHNTDGISVSFIDITEARAFRRHFDKDLIL